MCISRENALKSRLRDAQALVDKIGGYAQAMCAHTGGRVMHRKVLHNAQRLCMEKNYKRELILL